MFQVDGVQHEVKPGTLLHFAPGEAHGIWMSEKGKGEGGSVEDAHDRCCGGGEEETVSDGAQDRGWK